MAQVSEHEFDTVVSFRLRKDEAERLRQLARADDRPVSSFMRRVVLGQLQQVSDRQQVGA